MSNMKSLSLEPIGIVRSCYREKFGIPRQPGLVRTATAQLHLHAAFTEESVRGLAEFSHIWVQFVFHATQQQGWKPLVRPPRLGGNKKIGVFATRSTFRPNPLGLSVVELDDIERTRSGIMLHLRACDLMDKTPVLDIKPYLPYADSIPDASAAYARCKPAATMQVSFTTEARQQCDLASQRLGVDIHSLVSEILAQDPKPSYQDPLKNPHRIYAMRLYDFDLRWQYCENESINVLAIQVNETEYE